MIKYSFKEFNDKSSDFFYIKNFLTKNENVELFKYLNKMDDFRPCTNYQNKANRFQKWYQKDNKYFCPTWKNRYLRWESFTKDNIIDKYQIKIENKLLELGFDNYSFNSCLINKYLNGDDYIHFHRDSIESFGEYPLIVGLSLGSVRKINFRKVLYDKNNTKSLKKDKKNPINFSMELESGSLFIMSGSSQKYFEHEIPKCGVDNIRYSLTFREFLL
jgi:alkylated DNA repair dioxygenase AlkB